jgi:GH24 family phage-related lysozyme (muramidase)
VSYKNYFKNQGSQQFFTDYVNNKLETRRTYTPEAMETASEIEPIEYRAGPNGNAKYLPSYQNAGGTDMIWTLVDEDKVPIKGFDGTNITINTKDVNKALIANLKEQEKIALAKNYDSATLTKSDIDTVLTNIDLNKNNFFALQQIREQFGGTNKQIDAKLASLGDRGVPISQRATDEEVDQTVTPPKENIFTKGLNYLIDFFETRDVNINIDGIRRDFPELGSKGSQNPAWQYVYNQTITDSKNTPEVKKALEENFNEEVAINIVDDVVEVIEYLGDIEGYKEHGYKDGVGKHATISVGAGFNIKFLTDEDLAILSDDGRAKVKELQRLLKQVPSGRMSLDDIEAYSKKQGITITEEQSQKIFRNKVTRLYKQFTTEFPNFTTLSPERQSALIDHAYQMGYGAGEFTKYWKEVSRGLKTNDPKRRDYHFMMAGSHLIYNFNTEAQEAMSNLFVTGETLLNQQFQQYGLFGNDRIYDRAELLGFISDNKPTYMDKAGVFTRKVARKIKQETKDLIN